MLYEKGGFQTILHWLYGAQKTNQGCQKQPLTRRWFLQWTRQPGEKILVVFGESHKWYREVVGQKWRIPKRLVI